jgi:hypothetical protein
MNLVPSIVGVSCNSPAKLGSEEDEGIFVIVALSVKLACFEVMFGCSEKQPQSLEPVVKGLNDEFDVF